MCKKCTSALLSLFLLLLLASCIPTFTDATPDQLWLERQGDTYTLRTIDPIARGSVGVRAQRIESLYCVPVGCQKDAEGRVLLALPEGATYGRSVPLGRIVGLERARLVVVTANSDEALVRVVER